VNLFGFKTKKQKALEEEALIVGKNLKNMQGVFNKLCQI
jgi:hypothetical protein